MLLGDFTWSQQHIILNQSVSAMLRNKELHQTLVSIRIGFGGVRCFSCKAFRECRYPLGSEFACLFQ